MKLIAHRGNIDGTQKEYENMPDYIEHALSLGFDSEIDVRVKNGKLFLGHDEPQYELNIDWLEKYYTKLWLHCKDIEVIEKFHHLDSRGGYLNYFWHEHDTLTITSKGYLWVYPGKQPIINSIAVLPELNNDDVSKCYGVCSDYLLKYKKNT
jgi:hypothetical protein